MKKTIGWLVIGLIMAFVAALLFNLTNGFTNEVKSFMVARGNEYILNDTKGVMIVEEETFTVKHYTEDSEISAKLYPLELSNDYRFEVDGHEYSWNKDVIPRVKDFSEYVEIMVDQENNTVKIIGKLSTSLQKYAEKGAGGKEMKMLDTLPVEDMFRLDITTGDSTISMRCRLATKPTGVELNKTGVYIEGV